MLSNEEFEARLRNLGSNDEGEGCNLETYFDAVTNKETGEVIALIEKVRCNDCGEEYVENMWVRSETGRHMAIEMDMWDFDNEDDEEDF